MGLWSWSVSVPPFGLRLGAGVGLNLGPAALRRSFYTSAQKWEGYTELNP